MNERTEQIKALMSDEAFVKACLEAENEEAVQKMFADKGVEITLSEIELMSEMTEALAEGKITEEQLEKLTHFGELSEDELAEAAGGNLDPWGVDVGALMEEFGLGTPEYNQIYQATAKAFQDMKGFLKKAAEAAPVQNASSSGTSVGAIIGGIAVGAVAIAGLGYGVYNAVRRRW
ncbi:MAG: hypothetical protein IKN55_03770 [Oscillospiraceae bacterium]|nr:hypothetical protein [Oscillospiraceae bacterium]